MLKSNLSLAQTTIHNKQAYTEIGSLKCIYGFLLTGKLYGFSAIPSGNPQKIIEYLEYILSITNCFFNL